MGLHLAFFFGVCYKESPLTTEEKEMDLTGVNLMDVAEFFVVATSVVVFFVGCGSYLWCLRRDKT
jgi:hypothetical protein